MSKIVRAVNTMILNNDRISDVLEYSGEYYFLYDKKYKWAIRKSKNDVYFLTFYPGNDLVYELIEKIANNTPIEEMVYNTEDLKTREAEASFAELYLMIKEKLYNVDKILEEIIKEDPENQF